MATSMLQSAFAREGLVVVVPGQGPENYDALLDMDEGELAREREATLEALLAAVHGTNKPEEGTVTCLATGRSSDLCRITEAFSRLVEHGYIAEPALWPTTSGCWQRVRNQTEDEQSLKAVFWNTQSHDASFDPHGDLVDELHVHWAGDRDLIAEVLAGTGLTMRVPRNESTTFLLLPVASIASTDKFDVILESVGDQKIQVIKVLREVVLGLGVLKAKELVGSVPKPILEKVAKWAAKAAKEKLEAVGARVTLKPRSAEQVTTQVKRPL
jgi:ribosomal protein L7/L12